MHFSSESSGDECNERKYWKYLKTFKHDYTTPHKDGFDEIKEEDELSYTEFNAISANTCTSGG